MILRSIFSSQSHVTPFTADCTPPAKIWRSKPRRSCRSSTWARLRVIDQDGRVAGILTIDDLAHGVERRVGDGISGDEVALTLAAMAALRVEPAALARA
jgi:hypothetical protein